MSAREAGAALPTFIQAGIGVHVSCPRAIIVTQQAQLYISMQKKIKVALYLLLLPNLAFAYIDPGTGAYFIQVLFALIGAVIFYVAHPAQFIAFIKAKWRALKQRRKVD